MMHFSRSRTNRAKPGLCHNRVNTVAPQQHHHLSLRHNDIQNRPAECVASPQKSAHQAFFPQRSASSASEDQLGAKARRRAAS